MKKIPTGVLAFIITGAVFVVIIIFALTFGDNNENEPNENNSSQEEYAQTVDNSETTSEGDWSLGQDDAPVTIVVFTDFECPFCARFHNETFPQIEKE
jgi:protein-disulfide isomerase